MGASSASALSTGAGWSVAVSAFVSFDLVGTSDATVASPPSSRTASVFDSSLRFLGGGISKYLFKRDSGM